MYFQIKHVQNIDLFLLLTHESVCILYYYILRNTSGVLFIQLYNEQ